MANKAIIGVVTAVVLVAAVVGVIAVVSTNKGGSSDGELSATSKSVQAICSPTDFKEACEQTLTKALNGSTDPKAVIQAAVSATIDQVKAAFESSDNLTTKVTDSLNKMSMDDCKKLFAVAEDRLNAVLEVSKSEPDWTSKRADDINTWLSAVIAYTGSCTEDFKDPELKAAMEKAVSGAVEFTSNALALFKEFTSVINSLDIDASLNATDVPPKRRLLSFPSWMSAGDRRLLAGRGRRGRGGAIPLARPNVVVAKDGSGQFKSINAAVAAAPANSAGRYVIYVKAGIYNEQVLVNKPNIFMYGDGSRKTIVTGSKSVAKSGVNTKNTATFAVEAPGFVATKMGFSNTAGPEGEQAVALRVMGDRAAFFNCRMDAYQDTLYVQGERQFYRNCVVSGTVDFIFGDSSTVLQNCLIIARNPGKGQQNMVTAQGRQSRMETTGIVIHNCRIVPEQRLFPERLTIPTYLGRPWKAFSRTIVMESELGDLIRPEGWAPWQGQSGFVNTLYYAEYNNRGPGANTARRVRWPGYHVINRQTAQPFTPGIYIDRDNWIGRTGARYIRGFKSR